jgi:SET domain-containing protein
MPKPTNPPATEQPSIDARYTRFQLELRPSPIHRWGVYAGELIPKGRKIIEYTGERCNRKVTAQRADGPLNYLFTLDSYWTLDGSVGGSGAQYVNHSCEPNCHAWIYKGHILYMASRDIRAGEELTIDYHFEPDVPEVKCSCGAANCRGTINLKPEPRQKAAKKSATRKSVKAANKTAKRPSKKTGKH